MFRQAFVLALLAAFSFQLASSCSCFFVHEQASYCASHALRFRVVRSSYRYLGGGLRRQFTVRDVQVHKKIPNFDARYLRYIYSNSNGAACGVNLVAGRTYVVIGGRANTYGSRKYLFIGLCDHIITLTPEYNTPQLAFADLLLNHLYPASCDHCKICNSALSNSCKDGEDPNKRCDSVDVAGEKKLSNVCFHIDQKCQWWAEPGLVGH